MLSKSTPGRASLAAAMLSAALATGPAGAQHGGPTPDPELPRPEEAGPPAPPLLRPVPFEELPGWVSEGHAEILPALQASCAAIRPMRPEAVLGGQGEAAIRAGTPTAWTAICQELRILERRLPRPLRPGTGRAHERRVAAWLAERHLAVRQFLEQHFEPFAAGTGIMTGYYEPILRGSTTPDETFRTPLLARPPELVEQPVNGNPLRRRYGMMVDGRIEPFFDRAAIDTGVLAGRGLELVWVDDAADAFFLHIQGSGRVVLPGGEVLRMGFAGHNGRAYVSIGRLLIERGEVPREQMSMQAIRAWLASAGQDRASELLRGNPSYVFFRRVEGLTLDQGPIGALGVPLTPQRSVAVDRAFIPLGTPMFVTVRDPAARRDAPPSGRLVVAQDTGGAIRGPARTDYFWGWGPEAGDRAGRMRDESEVFVLLPRAIEVAAAREGR
ncbi:murein transglycosylase A [Neoroseomonas soli]|uniref:peptidoglycan lytic exotransglycosylase n=1 Tax=Neoroseomonas soli TaxID=1081025 RepID=A0A9X9WV59_9PROT|nr:MltA domain-containing protein [Neoroseomonas soli]MBR0671038.1 murein transglycosylase [Neoroseomonas soli]